MEYDSGKPPVLVGRRDWRSPDMFVYAPHKLGD